MTLISEIIDEWLSVQRKWLYLEGIFIGGDISAQLPEEAEKFNNIDREFQEVNRKKRKMGTVSFDDRFGVIGTGSIGAGFRLAQSFVRTRRA